MSNRPPHICVCICTYKRQQLLRRLLAELGNQKTDELFTFSLVVVDNDLLASSRSVVDEFVSQSSIPATYCVEPRQNIALARNKAIASACGDFVAFIDDDETPTNSWLLTLFNALHHYQVDGVLGPVKPQFDVTPPAWVVQGKFYDRPSYPTGFVIDWRKGRTGNVLLKRSLFEGLNPVFRPEFRTGEDQDLFRRLIARGGVFIWCHEAMAYEAVPATRWSRKFMLKRALLRGATSRLHPSFGAREAAKSILAVGIYAIALPVAYALGKNRYMAVLVRFCDHAGRVLALLGVNPIREPYVTE